MDEIRQIIEQKNGQFMALFAQGDAAQVAALHTENARILPPGNEMVQGRPGIQDFWQGVITSGGREVVLQTVDVQASGPETAYEVGHYTLTMHQGNESVRTEGSYVVIWKREEGEWKLEVDIWNS